MAETKKQNHIDVWKQFEKGLGFNNQQNLNETVQNNENFFIGKQWEGVESNGLPTPTYNFLKRVVLFTIASITSNNMKMQASALSTSGDKETVSKATNIINAEFEHVFEMNDIVPLMREYMRNAAVDGDGCTHTYWDADIETGQPSKGGIVTEIIENTRVHFGNANDRRVQKQPYIIIAKREMVDEAKDRAKENKGENWEGITSDTDDVSQNSENLTDDKVTVLLKYWKNKETKTIWGFECTKNAVVRPAWDTGLKLYPITWINWDYVQDNYHGMAMITGLIPNQIFINKLHAMSALSMMTTAFPKYIYDKTRISSWTNQIGVAIGVNGGDVNNVARIIDPAQISPQIAQFIQMALSDTQTLLGATNAAMGEGKAYNTSAIVALQKAASTPHELTKQNLYKSVEELGRIYIDFMREYYGKRMIEIELPSEMAQVAQFAGIPPAEKIQVEFDFSQLSEIYMNVKLDVGASAYWSEIANMQTLDNLLMQNKIEVIDYLERIPDGYVINREELVKKMKGLQQTMLPQGGSEGVGMDSGEVIAASSPQPTNQPIPIGRGNHEMQRAMVKAAGINK